MYDEKSTDICIAISAGYVTQTIGNTWHNELTHQKALRGSINTIIMYK